MSLSITDLAKARETAAKILQDLQLDAYLYEVEPDGETWEIKIECACEVNGGWETVTLNVPKKLLLGDLDDEEVKQHLLEYWKKKLDGCKVRQ